jgi:mannose-6-phosphate isomerase
MLEWTGFMDSAEGGHLGLGYPTALGCVDRSGWKQRLHSIVHRSHQIGQVHDLFGTLAKGFFRAQRLAVSSRVELGPSYAVLVVLDGAGQLTTEDGEMLGLGKGDTVVVPHAAGAVAIDGRLTAIRCMPPEEAR